MRYRGTSDLYGQRVSVTFMTTGIGAVDHAMCDVRRGRENGATSAVTIREMQMMGGVDD